MDPRECESILTDVLEQQSDLFQVSATSVTLVAGTWKVIANAQPTRLTLTILRGTFSDPMFFAPLPVGTVGLASAILDPLPYQIHASVFPLLIGGQWWGLSSGGQTITVLDIIRRMGGTPSVPARSEDGPIRDVRQPVSDPGFGSVPTPRPVPRDLVQRLRRLW